MGKEAMSRQEYIKIMKSIGGKMPPCAFECRMKSYRHCRDKEMECKAFRLWCIGEKYKHHNIGAEKRSIHATNCYTPLWFAADAQSIATSDID